MVATQYGTNPEEFLKFNKILTDSIPGYQPFYLQLEKGDKNPASCDSWKNNRKAPVECARLLAKGVNIGIAARDTDPLVIIDIDDLDQVPEIKPTLQVTSRKRIGRHNFFYTTDPRAKANINTRDAGEVRSNWEYVCAPGSFVACNERALEKMPYYERAFAGKYTLKNEGPLSHITFEEFPQVYRNREAELYSDESLKTISALGREKKDFHFIEGVTSELWNLNICEVTGLPDYGHTKRLPMPAGIHETDSESGGNCSITNGLLHCWRHGVYHTPFSYLAVLAGVKTCERAGAIHKKAKIFGANANDNETVLKVWLYAKKHNLIPPNDPIPRRALAAYAVMKGLVKKEDVEDTGFLDPVMRKVTLKLMELEGF